MYSALVARCQEHGGADVIEHELKVLRYLCELVPAERDHAAAVAVEAEDDRRALGLRWQEEQCLAIDAVHACSSGHLGLPLGCAEIGAVLFGHALSYCPAHPGWLNRDRFVLSAGHGSMFLYGWLHLAGYAEFTLDEVKRFRQLGSKTPGHPEREHHPNGVEVTTGPLGQGIANAVGLAMSAKMVQPMRHTFRGENRITLPSAVCWPMPGPTVRRFN